MKTTQANDSVIQHVPKQRDLREAAIVIASMIQKKSHNRFYRGRDIVVVANEDGSHSMSIVGGSASDHIYRNTSSIIGAYHVARDTVTLARHIYDDLTASG